MRWCLTAYRIVGRGLDNSILDDCNRLASSLIAITIFRLPLP